MWTKQRSNNASPLPSKCENQERELMKKLFRACTVVVATAAAALMWAAPASAHVTVNPDTAPREGYAKLTFRVPNEKDTPTVKLEVVFDEKQPIPVARFRPLPGWTAAVEYRTLDKPIEVHGEERTEAVNKITWTAAPGSEIKAGEFQEFEISVGPLPDADEVVFKALQYYEGDPEPVRWIDTGDDAEHPAPVLTLTDAEGDHHGGGGDNESASANDSDEADSAKKFALGALVLAVVGVGLAATALVRGRRS